MGKLKDILLKGALLALFAAVFEFTAPGFVNTVRANDDPQNNDPLGYIDENGAAVIQNGIPGTCSSAETGGTEYASVQEAIAAAADGDIVKLLNDVILTGNNNYLQISKNITLDLNDHCILKTDGGNNFIIIIDGNSNKLTLSDSAIRKTIRYIELNDGLGTSISSNKPSEGIEGEDYITVRGGCITGGNSSNGERNGGAVCVEQGTFIMTGGTICGNRANNTVHGGGVFVNKNRTFIMTGGTICNNKSRQDGGGVYISSGGHFEISGDAEIRDNKSVSGNGGGVYFNEGTFSMMGGTIKGNSAEISGGGIYFAGKDSRIISGGRIEGNTAGSGGGIYDRGDGGTGFKLTGGIITGNNAIRSRENGGGICAQKALFVSGSPIIKGNYFNGVLKDGVYVEGEGSLASNVKILNNGNGISVFEKLERAEIGVLKNGTSFTVVNGISESNLIGVNPYSLTADDCRCFFSDDPAYTVKFDSKENKADLVPAYSLTIKYGTGSGSFYEGAVVSIKADPPEEGKRFKEWEGADGLNFTTGSSTTATADFIMPERALALTARYEDIPTYTVTVINGTGSGDYEAGATVAIKADSAPEGQVFDKWTTEDDVALADWNAESTTFVMPGKPVTVTAAYKDKGSGENKEPEPEKEPDRVPFTEQGQAYASSDDNFAPIAHGASEGVGGDIKKLELDFSKVISSDVNPGDLRMTVIKGSRLTTKTKLQATDSFSTTGGVKVKVRKDLIPIITCKKDGSVTFIMADGNTYTIRFTVQKPKAQKSEKKLVKGGAPIRKTVRQLFGTDIDSGKLEIIKQKHSQASTSGDSTNAVIINPEEKDKIKLQYQYLNKKYKITITVK